MVGVESSVPFTACDDEDFPVAHSLPSAIDPRQFIARQGSLERTIEYQGEGVYEVAVRAELHGTEALQVER